MLCYMRAPGREKPGNCIGSSPVWIDIKHVIRSLYLISDALPTRTASPNSLSTLDRTFCAKRLTSLFTMMSSSLSLAKAPLPILHDPVSIRFSLMSSLVCRKSSDSPPSDALSAFQVPIRMLYLVESVRQRRNDQRSAYSNSSDAAIVTDPKSIKTAFFAHSFFDLYHFHEFFGFLVSK